MEGTVNEENLAFTTPRSELTLQTVQFGRPTSTSYVSEKSGEDGIFGWYICNVAKQLF